jgi:MFS family permease
MASPFSVRSFRFQWPADLLTSWAFEMEALILGWYVLVTTGSVQQLATVAALAWLGSLFSPFFGLAGDRVGHRNVLCFTRGVYALLAATLTALTLSEALQTWHIFAVAAIAGFLRPSDNVMRNVLVGQTMRPEMLMGRARLEPLAVRYRPGGQGARLARRRQPVSWRSSAWGRPTCW